MEIVEILNVTEIEPRFRHPLIFDQFDALALGESFIIQIDHDPKPLYYQLIAERGKIFTWEYLMSGPELYQVKISKNDSEQKEETIGEIVAKDYRKAQVFKKLGIDFCCGGKKTVSQVCDKKGLDKDDVKEELAKLDGQQGNPSQDYQKWDLDFLSDYIINTHHKYVKDTIPFLSEIAQKVASVHGANHPEVIRIAEVFAAVASDLSLHLQKEEKILFPYVKSLVLAEKQGTALPESSFGEVGNPIEVMEAEHEHVGEDLGEINELTNNYTVPQDACTSYRILYRTLEEFENDLHQHVHLENNILFPKAIELEKAMKL
ncbi:Nitric oxide-dependent regulator DnrN or NorA [Arcticibacter svalbardensis MN12-7]|uniref:Nitric oxide-dependent regulator DnrN or NorA n=1 Tax=Arcticibacter svalbardensis MN12-7 TaxID=1150600 RepID=R9GXQ3_9SPHI|nr:iron-sulfur cluster repair di-iron protein [Arcticibacter svalbardensis]EOR96453.1 Nitric oxide-dependent regulator DnrN or NorA [Arcticibacter svalbardensis MN12-7]